MDCLTILHGTSDEKLAASSGYTVLQGLDTKAHSVSLDGQCLTLSATRAPRNLLKGSAIRKNTKIGLQVDLADDGHSWLKYGEKKRHHMGKPVLRSYYKCSTKTTGNVSCSARKVVDWVTDSDSISAGNVNYVNQHNHPVKVSRRKRMTRRIRIPASWGLQTSPVDSFKRERIESEELRVSHCIDEEFGVRQLVDASPPFPSSSSPPPQEDVHRDAFNLLPSGHDGNVEKVVAGLHILSQKSHISETTIPGDHSPSPLTGSSSNEPAVGCPTDDSTGKITTPSGGRGQGTRDQATRSISDNLSCSLGSRECLTAPKCDIVKTCSYSSLPLPAVTPSGCSLRYAGSPSPCSSPDLAASRCSCDCFPPLQCFKKQLLAEAEQAQLLPKTLTGLARPTQERQPAPHKPATLTPSDLFTSTESGPDEQHRTTARTFQHGFYSKKGQPEEAVHVQPILQPTCPPIDPGEWAAASSSDGGMQSSLAQGNVMDDDSIHNIMRSLQGSHDEKLRHYHFTPMENHHFGKEAYDSGAEASMAHQRSSGEWATHVEELEHSHCFSEPETMTCGLDSFQDVIFPYSPPRFQSVVSNVTTKETALVASMGCQDGDLWSFVHRKV